MAKIKIFNDPLYGLINFPFELIYELIDHRYFQRLRRIGQVGLSNLVYPGAVHTRFHHALGVAHLCSQLILNLRLKGIDISDEEYEATCCAALLHDIGHGPYSHALEHQILPVHHEDITSLLIHAMNEELGGRLSMAIQIFDNKYPKKYLHQILSSQVDVDRMDYLNRDSYYTGVAEGVIGYDRIIRMMNVHEGQLVVEKKGLYSLEKFFIARYLMYKQVYMHKTAIGAEQMLKLYFSEYKKKVIKGKITTESTLNKLLQTEFNKTPTIANMETFAQLDDADILQILKEGLKSKSKIMRFLANGILNRRLFKVKMQGENFKSDQIKKIRHKLVKTMNWTTEECEKMIILGQDNSYIYDQRKEVLLLGENGKKLHKFSELSEVKKSIHQQSVNFLCYPKLYQ